MTPKTGRKILLDDRTYAKLLDAAGSHEAIGVYLKGFVEGLIKGIQSGPVVGVPGARPTLPRILSATPQTDASTGQLVTPDPRRLRERWEKRQLSRFWWTENKVYTPEIMSTACRTCGAGLAGISTRMDNPNPEALKIRCISTTGHMTPSPHLARRQNVQKSGPTREFHPSPLWHVPSYWYDEKILTTFCKTCGVGGPGWHMRCIAKYGNPAVKPHSPRVSANWPYIAALQKDALVESVAAQSTVAQANAALHEALHEDAAVLAEEEEAEAIEKQRWYDSKFYGGL